jgi:hypothetical protein
MTGSSDRDQRRLYGDLAWTWPIISAAETYVEESERFVALLREHSQIEPDRHFCGIFPTETWLSLLREAGFEVTEALEKGPEVATTFICLKPAAAA